MLVADRVVLPGKDGAWRGKKGGTAGVSGFRPLGDGSFCFGRGMVFTIRQAAETDIEAILDLWWEMMDFHARVDARFHPLPRAEAAEAWEKHLREDILGKDGWCVLVADSGDHLVGMLIGSLRDPYPVFEPERYGFVAGAVVAPDVRRSGVGRAMFNELKAWFREQGVSHAQLEVSHLNATSQGFWRAMGCTGYMDTMWVDVTD